MIRRRDRQRINRLTQIPVLAVAMMLTGCGTGSLFDSSVIPGGPGGPRTPLSAAEVNGIITAAARSLGSDRMVIAVTDREGNILGLFRKDNAPDMVNVLLAGRRIDVDTNELAVSLARTASFFSNDQAPLSSRTVRFISREHFPPTFAPDGKVTGVDNTPSGALWNIEGTNRGCTLSNDFIAGKEIRPARSVDGQTPGLGVATIPGGVPLFRGGNKLVGGVGVAGASPEAAEEAALAAAALTGFAPLPPPPGVIFIDGVRLPFVSDRNEDAVLEGRSPLEGLLFGSTIDVFENLTDVGAFVPVPSLADPNQMVPTTQASPRQNVPEGWLVGPKGSAELSVDEVRTIIEDCIFQAHDTRAAIRLPLNVRAKMVISVTDLQGEVLGLYRMPDATVFSIDVAVTKARNVVYFSGRNRSFFDLPGVPMGTAITNRTLRFGSQPFYPPGIDAQSGPFFLLLQRNLANPCTQGFQNPGPNQSGIVFFPGSAPLYRGGFRLVGGLGVSGDGVDQDDFVTAAGAALFEPADFMRADRVFIRDARLPYFKFPRAPEEGR